MPSWDQVARQEFVPIYCNWDKGMMSHGRSHLNRVNGVLVTGERNTTCKRSSKIWQHREQPAIARSRQRRTVMAATYAPYVPDGTEDQGPAGVTDERKIGPSQHRFFCECGNVITAPSASAYIEPGGIRHVWVCNSCQQTFETSIAPVSEAESRSGPAADA